MTQSPLFMQISRIFCGAAFLAGALALAQDNPTAARTNSLENPVLPGLTNALPGVTNAVRSLNYRAGDTNLFAPQVNQGPAPAAFVPPPMERPPLNLVSQTNAMTFRSISLDEAVQMALQHNYAVRISRLAPEIAGFTLAGAYSVYEPAASFSAIRSFNSSPGGFDPQGIPLPSSEIRDDTFAGGVGSGLGGYAPTGLRYSLDGNISHREFSGIGGNREQYTGSAGIRLQQPLLRDFWIDRERMQILVDKKNLSISEWQLRNQLMTTITSVEEAYYNLIFLRENVRVQQTALTLANQLLRENKKRVEVGALAPLDERQAEAQVASTVADLIAAEQDYLTQQNALKNLITDNFADWNNIILEPMENLVAVPADLDIAESWRRSLTMRPDLQQIKLELERRDITLKYLKNQLWPALDLVGSYGHNALNTSYRAAFGDIADDRNPRYSYGLTMSIPLGNTRARNDYKASKAEKQQDLLRYKQLEQTIMVEVDNAVKLLKSEFQRVEATRQARLFAQDALRAEQKKLENGKSTSFNVLQFQRDLTRSQFLEIQALARYNIALSELAQREGTTLDRHNMSMKLK